MSENLLQSATKAWIEAVQSYFKDSPDRNKLTQIYMRGYFTGWSEREIASFVDRLAQNENDYPLWTDKIKLINCFINVKGHKEAQDLVNDLNATKNSGSKDFYIEYSKYQDYSKDDTYKIIGTVCEKDWIELGMVKDFTLI
jgi:hypothetical protein